MAVKVQAGARPRPDDRAVSASHHFYRPELDLLRLCAFFMVWLSHALLSFRGLAPAAVLSTLEGAGSCGVPIFFLLSAYLITELLRREREATGTIHLRSFYLRRILRIWPLYLGVLAVYGLLGLHFHGFHIEPGRLLASLLLAGNWYIAFHPLITTPMRALWSVSVEEQWYLLWPLLRRAFSTKRLLALCGATVVFSHLILFVLARTADPGTLHVTAWVNSGVQFQYFALGAGCALVLRGRLPQIEPPMRCLLGVSGAGALLLAASVGHIKEASTTHSALSLSAGYGLAGAGAAALFFAALGVPARFCPPYLVRLGQLSFGLYVFHETGFFLANATARLLGLRPGFLSLTLEKLSALLLAGLLAWLSYHYWELPFLRLKQRWTFVQSREAR